MGHPEIDNRTPFAFEALFASSERSRPVVAPLVKATFEISARGELELSPEQVPVNLTGEWFGDPGESSQRFEPESAFVKPSTDVVLIGHAHARRRDSVRGEVELRVGPLVQRVLVSGDRAVPSPVEPFERIPLVYERCYGGWDRSHPNPERHRFHPGNPVGVGFRARGSRFQEGAPLPNLEDPRARLTRYRGRSRPAGFGFTCPHWEPRRRLAGTYDAAWERERMPLLPEDFQRRFFNAAAPALIAPRFLRGDEAVLVRGASPEGQLSFRLPAIQPPVSRLSFRDRPDETLVGNLDTVIIDLDARKLLLLWRAFTGLDEGPLDVRAIEVSAEGVPVPTAASHPPENVVSLRRSRAA